MTGGNNLLLKASFNIKDLIVELVKQDREFNLRYQAS